MLNIDMNIEGNVFVREAGTSRGTAGAGTFLQGLLPYMVSILSSKMI